MVVRWACLLIPWFESSSWQGLFGHIPSLGLACYCYIQFPFVLPSLNYLLNIEFARYKISTSWDHKADWDNGKGGVSRSAIDYRQTFPELKPSLSIQDTTTCTTTTGICGMRVSGLGLYRSFPSSSSSNSGYGSSGEAERASLTFPLDRPNEGSCRVSQWQKKEISLPIGRKGRVNNLFLPIDVWPDSAPRALAAHPITRFPRLPSEKRRGISKNEIQER